MLPSSTKNVPAMALSSVDLPEPLVPTTITNDPCSMARSTPCSERTSLIVPAWNVLRTPRSSSMRRLHFLPTQLAQQARQNQRHEHEGRRDHLQIVWIQTPTQRDGHQQP